MTTVRDVLTAVEAAYPPKFAMRDDRIGLMVGSLRHRVRAILVVLDPDLPAVTAARKFGANLIVSHHPIWWKAPKTLVAHETTGRGAVLAAVSGISVIAAHTNADFAPGGLCDGLCGMLSLLDAKPLTREGESMIGRIGVLADPAPVRSWLRSLGRGFGSGVRYCGLPPKRISRVAVCSGSGSDLLQQAYEADADALVTGDVKYHAARDAEELGRIRRADSGPAAGFLLVDAGHFATEKQFVPRTIKKLRGALPGLSITGFLEPEPFRS